MVLGIVVFKEIGYYLYVHKPSNVTINEINYTCTNLLNYET